MYLAVDVTSKSVKCAAGDLEQGIIAKETRHVPVRCSDDGFCRSCEETTFFDGIVETINAVLASPRVDPRAIRAVSAASIRPSCVFTDIDLNPVYIGASFDLRGSDAAGELTDRLVSHTGKSFHEATGHFPALMFPPARYAWFKEEAREACKNITHYLPLEGWLLAMMGGEPHASETCAAESGFYDIDRRTWIFEWEEILDLPREFLPFIVPPGEVIGETSQSIESLTGIPSGTMLVSGMPDTQAALLGAGCINAGDGCSVVGSTTPVQGLTGSRVVDPAGRAWNTRLALKGIVDCHVIEASAGITGQVLPWLARLLFPGEPETASMDKLDTLHDTFDADQVKDREMSVLALLGPTVLASSQTGMDAGTLLFPSPCSVDEMVLDHPSLVAATFENVLFAVKENAAYIESISGKFRNFYMLGGMTRGKTFVQRFADLSMRDVITSTEVEATITGLFATCAVATGDIGSPAGLTARVANWLDTRHCREEKHGILQARLNRWNALRARAAGI